jgi:ergothioneine biosynthesis protein EgtC
MCRFTLYLGQPIRLDHLITEPENSLIHQSYESQEREEPLNGDGFGIAFYVPEVSPEPAVFRSISPAWSNRNLQQIARVTRSPCVLAHVRAATPGSAVAEANCHPFVHGKYAFMHNGHLAGFRQWRRALLGKLSDEAFQLIEGSTDSEHMFALFVDRLHALGDGDATAMAAALRATFTDLVALAGQHGVTEPSYLNVAVSDGRCAVISRFTTDVPENADSLYYHIGKRYTSVGGFTAMIEAETGRGSVLVSSERLSDDPGWEPVPVNHLVILHDERRVELQPA